MNKIEAYMQKYTEEILRLARDEQFGDSIIYAHGAATEVKQLIADTLKSEENAILYCDVNDGWVDYDKGLTHVDLEGEEREFAIDDARIRIDILFERAKWE